MFILRVILLVFYATLNGVYSILTEIYSTLNGVYSIFKWFKKTYAFFATI